MHALKIQLLFLQLLNNQKKNNYFNICHCHELILFDSYNIDLWNGQESCVYPKSREEGVNAPNSAQIRLILLATVDQQVNRKTLVFTIVRTMYV